MKTGVTRMMFRVIILFEVIIVLASCSKPRFVSLKTLLMEMTDRNSITLLPDPYYTLRQSGSYDRKTVSPSDSGWFANDDYTQFIGIDSSEGRKEYILLDSDGPGAIVRWWMTFAGEGSLKGIIRVYIDGKKDPVFQSESLKLFSDGVIAGAPLITSVSPDTEVERRGQDLYLPIPYARHCRITYECDAIIITKTSRKPNIYYNICYRAYEKETKVISFSMDELKYAAELIRYTNRILLSADSTAVSKEKEKFTLNKLLQAGDLANLNIDRKNSAISKISIKLSAFDNDQALRSTVIKIIFDGNQTVWVPVGYFFGTGSKETSSSTWYSKVDGRNVMECFWIMPFIKTCKVSILNISDREIKSELEVYTSDYKWRETSMYFGSSWHEYHQIHTAGARVAGGTGNHRDINYVDIKGVGVYAGDAVTVFNSVKSWWGEGDEKIFVDGESFPSSIGTVTEDYYGYAWCRPEKFTHPFIAQPSGSGNFNPGLSINMRYRNLDAIPFRTSISSNIELWHWLPAVINYGLTSYWYIKPPYEINIKPDPEDARRPVPTDPENPL